MNFSKSLVLMSVITSSRLLEEVDTDTGAPQAVFRLMTGLFA